MTSSRSGLLFAAAVSASAVLATQGVAPATSAGGADPVLVSRASGASGEKANAAATSAEVSEYGRYVIFESTATNLVPGVLSGVSQIYIRDVESGTTELVSRASGAAGAAGDDHSGSGQISPDGRFVAFASRADNLTDEPGIETQVYVRDLVANTTTLVSRATGQSGAIADPSAHSPSISADGRIVAFQSRATNLSPGTVGTNQVYVRDLAAGTTTLVSHAKGGPETPANSQSGAADISADGSKVAFVSVASNIVGPLDRHERNTVYVNDRATNNTSLVSRASGKSGAVGKDTAGQPRTSADGTKIAFISDSRNLVRSDQDPNYDVFVRDTESNRTVLASRHFGDGPGRAGRDAVDPSISGSGRYVSFEGNPGLNTAYKPAGRGLFIRDLRRARTTRLSKVPRPDKLGRLLPSLSADGRFVAFQSDAHGLLDTRGGFNKLQVFVTGTRN